MKKILRFANVFYKTADKSIEVIDKAETGVRKIAFLVASLIFAIIVGTILVLSGVISLFV